MSFDQDGRAIAGNGAVENGPKARRVTVVQRTLNTFTVAGTSGIIGAALAANASVFAMRNDLASPRRVFIERVRLQYTCIVAYTVPITAGRRLGLYRGNGAAASGGTALTPFRKASSVGNVSEVDSTNGGDARISTTAALTVTGITFETPLIAEMHLSHMGTAGAFFEEVFQFNPTDSAPIVLEPGQLLAVRAPVAFDAAGTWQLGVRVDWHEGQSLDSSTAE